jgi:3-isopropylmalate/(R)-2-methylmalate dehydratase small subunit
MALAKITQVTGRGVNVPGNDIDTDRIIPARFMKCVSFDGLGEFVFHDVRKDAEGNPRQHPLNEARFQGATILISGANFGCGSSREHAPWVFEVNDIHTIIAESYARIFRQNMFNCGMLAIELPAAEIQRLFDLEKAATGKVEIDVSLERQEVVAKGAGRSETFRFEISPFDKALVQAGGWVDYADARY